MKETLCKFIRSAVAEAICHYLVVFVEVSINAYSHILIIRIHHTS